jgi:hypothetical protein
VQREWQVTLDALFTDFLTHGADQLEPRWYAASTIDTVNLRLTSEQLAAMVAELQAVGDRYIRLYRDKRQPGSRPVQLQVDAFPVMDAEEIPRRAVLRGHASIEAARDPSMLQRWR